MRPAAALCPALWITLAMAATPARGALTSDAHGHGTAAAEADLVATPPPADLVATATGRLLRLDHQLRLRLAAADHRAAARLQPDSRLPGVGEHLGRALADVRRSVAVLDAAVQAPVVSKVRALELQLHNLELAAGGARPASGLLAPGLAGNQRWASLRAAEHGDCAHAVPLIRAAGFAGVTPPPTASAPFEVWFRVTAREAGVITASSVGSDFDTTLAVFSACPGAPAAEVASDDDAHGLQAVVGFHVEAGQRRWIRLAGSLDGPRRFALQLGTTGAIVGSVRRLGSRLPVTGGYVDIWDTSGFHVSDGYLDANGYYLATGLSTASYFATTDTYSSGLLDELYDDIPCPGGGYGGCDPLTGTQIAVTDGQATAGIDFALGAGGVISGRLRDASTLLPIPQVHVKIWNDQGDYVASTYTDLAGRYRIHGLLTATYFATAEASGYLAELYDDVPCPGGLYGGCTPTGGTPIPVVRDQSTVAIDFDLVRLGSLQGRVTDAVTGAPIAAIEVDVYNAAGGWVGDAYTNGSGDYSLAGLDTGSYFAFTYDYDDEYRDELYDDVPCQGYCEPTSGTPIAVSLGTATDGIDFALDRLGSVEGKVTDVATGTPLYGIEVVVWDSDGYWVNSAYSDLEGKYHVAGLDAGTYTVATYYGSEYADELYDDIPCEFCDPTTGTPVAVSLDATTPGIDFALRRKGRITGTVTDAVTGDPIAGAQITVWTSEGGYAGDTATDALGGYSAGGLDAGSYFLTTETYDHVDELYDDLPCSGYYGCDPTVGTPVPVALEEITSGIDFALEPAGWIVGSVVATGSLAPIPYVEIDFWDAGDHYAGSAQTDSAGLYVSPGLGAGSFYVTTFSYDYENEIYDDIPCPAACEPTTGTPVAVTYGTTTSAIDFALDLKGAISGSVTDAATGLPIDSAYVRLYSSSGAYASSAYTDSTGTFWFTGLDAGDYYAVASSYYFEDELFDELPCGGGCDPSTGTPITVVLDATTTDIDFTLDLALGIGGHVADSSGRPLAGVAIDFWHTSGTYIGATVTGASGRFQYPIDSGSYYASTDNGLGGLDEIYDDVPCPLGSAYDGLCDPLTGTPVTVVYGQPAAVVVDFVLTGFPLFRDGFESGDLGAWSGAVGGP
jgi:Carboxypeptidase regulatory-like domain